MASWDVGSSSSSSSSSSSRSRVADDTVYVAVGKDFEENKLNLLWAIENFPGKVLCILHVHQPAKVIPLVGGKFPAVRLEQHELREFHEVERKITRKILDDYLLCCHQADARAEKLYIEMDDIGKGIVELMYEHDIKKLVMGAAANKHYSEQLMDVKSTKAQYVEHRAPHSCQIWYICKGYLITTWEGDSAYSFTNGFGDSVFVMRQRTEGVGLELELCEVPQTEEDSLSLHALEESHIDQLSGQLEQAILEAENLKQEAYEESRRRREAERKAIKALCRVKDLEILYAKELRYRKETEEALAREKEDHRRTKNKRDEERLITMDQRLLQQIQASDFDGKIKELNDEKLSALEQCEEYKKENDELISEVNNVLKLAQELSEELSEKQAEEASCLQTHLSVFPLSEIEEVTCNFDPLLRIGETRHGSIYKAFLRHTEVAIKVLGSYSQNEEFQQEVDMMSSLRHPNLAVLIGACKEARSLVYEYLPNGSLEDRLNCKDNSPPLPWQIRIRVATELCSVLIFLHSNKPHSIVHSNLGSRNVLLDANFSCKLMDVGICQTLLLHEGPSNETESRGTFHHLDPHFLTTGELSPKSDTYSFGIILFRLLTGKSSFSIVTDIRDVIDEGNLGSMLDPLAGDWPFDEAKQLVRLASSCCATDPHRRPDLASEAWRVLEPMRASCSSLVQFGSQDNQNPPSYFVCPILQEVMEEPCVAADGFTYEAEALRGWLRSGHNTSPMTNLELEHSNLIPNLSLRSAIREWMQQQ